MPRKNFPDGSIDLKVRIAVPEGGITRYDLLERLGAIGATKVVVTKYMPAPIEKKPGVKSDPELDALRQANLVLGAPDFSGQDMIDFGRSNGYHGAVITSVARYLGDPRDNFMADYSQNGNYHDRDWLDEKVEDYAHGSRDSFRRNLDRGYDEETALKQTFGPSLSQSMSRWNESSAREVLEWPSLINQSKNEEGVLLTSFDSFIDYVDQGFSPEGKGGKAMQGPLAYNLMKSFAVDWWQRHALAANDQDTVERIWADAQPVQG